MSETPRLGAAVRATVVFDPDPEPTLRCSQCSARLTDDDADCPTCASPIDWGASMAALRAWQRSHPHPSFG
jgi:hypothetical protein